MANPVRQFVDGKYGQIHLRISTPETIKQRPLICLHMFPQSGRNFEHFLSAASRDRIVIAPDFPGYGESDPPPEPISAEEYAASVWDVVSALALDDMFGTVDLFGIHAGSKLAVEVAYQQPSRVNNIVLSSAAILSANEVAELRSIMRFIPLDDQGIRFQHFWQLQIENRGAEMSYEMMATGLAEMLRGGERYEWGHYAVFDYNAVFPERLKSLPHPIALLNPKDDLYEMTPRTLPYMQNGQLYDHPEWSSGFMEIHATDLANVVDDLLRETDAPPAMTDAEALKRKAAG